MKPYILTAILAAAISATAAPEQPAMTCRPLPSPAPAATCDIDSVENRADLTRVYCTYTGRPHTSDRIDSVTLIYDGGSPVATDIDGVDFKRYFQWEDEGRIALEIDFAPLTRRDGECCLRFETVHGVVETAKYRLR